MGRRKVDKNETESEKVSRKKVEKISGHASRSEKTTWIRKRERMASYVNDVNGIEERILDIVINEKIPLMDKVDELHKDLIDLCIHPYDELVDEGDHILCKFCNKRLKVSDG